MRLRALADAVARPGEDVLGRLVQIFVEDSEVRLVVLRSAGLAPADAGRAAHNIKGAAANMGALRVVAAAIRVEAAARAGLAADDQHLAARPEGIEFVSAVATLALELNDAAHELRRSFGLRG